MEHRTVGKLLVKVKIDDAGDLYPVITPILLSTNGVEYAKLALLAAEMSNHIGEQLTVMNIDEGGKIEKMAKMILRLDDNGNLPNEKRLDIEPKQVQMELPMEVKDVSGTEESA